MEIDSKNARGLSDGARPPMGQSQGTSQGPSGVTRWVSGYDAPPGDAP